MDTNFSEYDLIIVNSSGGKDSLCALYETCRIAKLQSFPLEKIVVSHQDLGDMEWAETKELVCRQAKVFGLETHVSKRRDKDGYEESLLEYVERRGKWPSSKQRFCTSDFKRGPGARVVTNLTKGLGKCKVLQVFGFRSEESPSRAKKEIYKLNDNLSTQKRQVFDWLPIHDWTTQNVWQVIKNNNLPYHKAYDLGMPRLSCVFCIFSPKDALVVAGKHNPELLDRYVEVEKKIGHSFRDGFSISTVKDLIDSGYVPQKISNWIM
jgi:3'-phosphoadenosine 5'-phosphosulfate sulfotransferase (PAPS reductase)/FAD synthetase